MKHVANILNIAIKERGKKEMKKKIIVSEALRAEICKKFGVRRTSVWRALNYVGGVDKSQEIRDYALSRGGECVYELPCLETVHDADGHMRQYLPNGVEIDFDKTVGSVVVRKNGDENKRYENVKISEIAGIQEYAYSISGIKEGSDDKSDVAV